MKHDITRKQFLHLGIGAAAFVTGCAGDDGTDTNANTDGTTTDPATTDPATTDPATTDPVTTDPSTTTDPATTDPATTDPATTDPSTSTDPATTDPTGDTSGTDSTGTTGDAFDCSVDPMVIIGANHMHTLVVTAAEIAAGVEIVYDIQGTSPHGHSVTLTDADFATLMSEGQVVVESTSMGHSHTITVTCV